MKCNNYRVTHKHRLVLMLMSWIWVGAVMAQEVNVEEAGRGRVRHLSEDQATVEVQVVAEAAPTRQKVEQEIKTRQEVGAEAAKLKTKEESAQLNAENEAQPVAEIKSAAEAVGVETLISAIRDARTSDPKWRGAIHARETALEKLPQARAGLLPEVSIGIQRNRNFTNYATTNSEISIDDIQHTFVDGSFRVKLIQPLFNWDRLVGYQQAEYDVLAAEKQYEQDNQDFLLRVAQAYFDLAAAIEVHAAAAEHVAALGEQYRLTSKSYQIGIGNITELYEAEAKLELGKGDELSSKRQMELSRRKFRSIVGRDNYHLVLLKNNIKFSPPSPSDEHSWTSNAMANSPEILRKQAVLEKVRLEIEKRRAEYFPTVDGVIAHSRSYSERLSYNQLNSGFIESKRYIGVEATIPLFSGLSVVSKVREAESKKYEALEDVEYSRRTLGNDIAEAYGFVTDGLDELERYQKALEGSRKSEKANRLGYKIGIKSNLDVLNSQQQVFTDTRRVVKAKYDVIYYSLKLKALVGELDEAEFLEIDHLFEKALPPSQERNG